MSWLEEEDKRISHEYNLTLAIVELAQAINRLAATQEKPAKTKGAVSFSTASFKDRPDEQTSALRELAGHPESE